MIDIISFLGLLSTIMIFNNVGQFNKFNIYLGFFFLSMSSFIIGTKLISLTTNYYIISIMFPLFAGILMSTGPMLYFYTRSILKSNNKNFFYYIHYLPIILILVDLIPFYLKSREYQENFYEMVQLSILHVYKIDTLFLPIQYFLLFRFLSGIFYALWCLITTIRSKKYFINNKKKSFLNNYYWLMYLSGFILLIFSVFFFSIIYIKFFANERILSIKELPSAVFSNHLFSIGIIFAVIFIPSILFNPRILFFRKNTEAKSTKKNQIKDFKTNSLEESLLPAENENKVGSESSSNFTQIAEKLALYFYGKPYLQPGFNLSIITNETDIPYHKVTSYFTVYLGIPFNDWKNDMRVEHAIELIKHGQAKNQTIESIAYSCGFLSRSNFVNSFKKKTGLTPSEYLKSLPEGNLVVSLNF
jgi:AraC-like DNA-binding protein